MKIKYNFIMLLNFLLRTVMIAGAIFMAINNIKGYGWLIFGALICKFNVEINYNEEDEE